MEGASSVRGNEAGVVASWGCPNQRPHTGGLQTTGVFKEREHGQSGWNMQSKKASGRDGAEAATETRPLGPGAGQGAWLSSQEPAVSSVEH